MALKDTKFGYILNYIHYGIWLDHIAASKCFERIIYAVIGFFVKILPDDYKESYNDWKTNRQPILDRRRIDKEYGYNVSFTDRLFGSAYSCVIAFLSLILVCPTIYFSNEFSVKRIVAISVATIFLAYIPAYLKVFHKDRYLVYYKLFEKKDSMWQKKCKKHAAIFVILSWVLFFSYFILLAALFINLKPRLLS